MGKTQNRVKGSKKNHVWIVPVIISAFVTVTFLVLFFIVIFATEETKSYNAAAEEYNEIAKKYNNEVQKVAVYNIEGMPEEFGSINNESVSYGYVLLSVLRGNTPKKISEDIETIHSLIGMIDEYFQVFELIDSPEESLVVARIKNVESITGYECVTEEHNPDGLLGKEEGYEACIYFTTSYFSPSDVPGTSIVEKGTDGGGAIEIYSSKEKAEARCEYLAQFDNTILYSGSYAIVGTMVIRTSYALNYEEQLELTNLITEALTSL